MKLFIRCQTLDSLKTSNLLVVFRHSLKSEKTGISDSDGVFDCYFYNQKESASSPNSRTCFVALVALSFFFIGYCISNGNSRKTH